MVIPLLFYVHIKAVKGEAVFRVQAVCSHEKQGKPCSSRLHNANW